MAAPIKRAVVVAALALILPVTARFEGLVFHAYADPAHGWKVPTICYGHTKGVKRGDTATKAQCDAWLREDMDAAMADVARVVTVELSANELAAYGDFVFNAGLTNFRTSTMLRKLNAGDRRGACAELSRWVYSAGQYLAGLKNRREVVRDICERNL